MKFRKGFVSNSSSSSYLVVSNNEQFLKNCSFNWLASEQNLEDEYYLREIRNELGDRIANEVREKKYGVHHIDLPYDMSDEIRKLVELLELFGETYIVDLES